MSISSAPLTASHDIARPGSDPLDRRSEFRSLLTGSSKSRFLTSAWQHFVGDEYDPDRFAATVIDFNRSWDWDWVKINPRAVYYSEVWGSVYDPHDYAGVIPTLVSPAIRSTEDLKRIRPVDPRTNPALSEHLASARLIREGLPDQPLLQTVFSPLSVLFQLAALPLYPNDTVPGAGSTRLTHQNLLTDDRENAHRALSAIAQTFADYVRLLLAPIDEGGAGLDGIFYAVTGTANASLVSPPDFAEFSRRYDLEVLEAADGAPVILHTCGPDSHPEWFTGYPVDALHWDQFKAGNPTLDADLGITVVGGPHHELFAPDADHDRAGAQLDEILQAAPDRPFLLAPSCTVPTPADDSLLRLLRDAR